jgi:hypothetical protein
VETAEWDFSVGTGDGSPKVLIGAHPSGHAIHDDTDFPHDSILPFQI